MSLSISKTVSESVSISDSAKSASIITDSVGIVWGLANEGIVNIAPAGSNSLLNMSNGNQYSLTGVAFADAKAAFLATRS